MTPPKLIDAPTNETVLVGSNANFQAQATGTLLSFQWQFNSTNISGATNSTLNLTNVQPDQAGNYTITITNLAGNAASAVQLITEMPPIGISIAGTNVYISVRSVVGLSYTLEFKNSLSDASWTPVLPAIPGSGGVIALPDPAPSANERFYRVECQ